LARRLRGHVGMVKVGNQLFTAEGPSVVRSLARMGFGIFLDLKFHDIPNTVGHGVASACWLPGVRLLTLHTLGASEMILAARRAADSVKDPPKLLGVTLLTSHDEASIRQVGIIGPLSERAVKLAKLANAGRLDGVVSSAREVRDIRRAVGPKMLIVVPGIRPADASSDDQARVATPGEAIRAGADYLVIGRPITAAKDPRKAVERISAEISAAHS
jgi:orotidine-5'-phosphate decarboxylase